MRRTVRGEIAQERSKLCAEAFTEARCASRSKVERIGKQRIVRNPAARIDEDRAIGREQITNMRSVLFPPRCLVEQPTVGGAHRHFDDDDRDSGVAGLADKSGDGGCELCVQRSFTLPAKLISVVGLKEREIGGAAKLIATLTRHTLLRERAAEDFDFRPSSAALGEPRRGEATGAVAEVGKS